jgi:hypothetical protein
MKTKTKEMSVKCEDCKEETPTNELKNCHVCGLKLCSICLELHAEEHYAEDEEEEIRKVRDKY